MAAKLASKAAELSRVFGLARALALTLISLTAGGYSSGQNATIQTLQGRVVDDSTSTPIRSVELRFRMPGMRVLTADLETDSDGKFVGPEMPAGDYEVTAFRTGYAPLDFRLRVPIGEVTVRMIREGARSGAISGKVVNAAGKPVPWQVLGVDGRQLGGARVAALIKSPESGEFEAVGGLIDPGGGPDGHFRITNLPPGEYAVGLWYSAIDEGAGMQIYPDNAHPRIFTIHGGEEVDGVDFLVDPHPSSRVSGKIEIPDDARGQYRVSLGLPEHYRIPLATVQADDDGVFHFDKIPAGKYDVFVAGPAGGRMGTLGMAQPGQQILFGRAQVQVAGQDVEHLNIAVRAGKTLNVLLHSATAENTGCPQTARVTASSPEPWPVVLQLGAQANFQKPVALSDLPPGSLDVMLAPTDDCFASGDSPVIDLNSDNTPQQVVIELTRGGSVKGALSPVASGSLVVLRRFALGPADGFVAARAYTGGDGLFEFQKLAPGHYRVEAAGYRDVEIDVKGGATSELSLTAVAQRSTQ